VLVSPTPNRMSRMVAFAVACALFGLIAQATAQQSAPQPVLPDVRSLTTSRIAGARFHTARSEGPVTDAGVSDGPKGLMLVFFRSADW